MSASRDDTQKISFVYSNLYEIYRRGKKAAQQAPSFEPAQPASSEYKPTSGVVLKSDDLKRFGAVIRDLSPMPPKHVVEEYRPVELLGRKVGSAPEAMPASLTAKVPAAPARAQNAVESLKGNLKNLNELHTRLQFMLKEIEELMKA